ncbi:MAG: DNA polymerase I [Candidatus Yanofskybacteria bacterium]|nr:DNA polymerase I [Candidatus Yanofskybacteria bacterium]
MKKIILIDGNALVHRAFHALPPLTSPSGAVTNAVFGFSSIFIKMIKELKPDFIAATFDLKGPTFRHEKFAEYKIHREKAPDELYRQIPLVKEVLAAFGVPIYEKEGYEADDLIGTLAAKAKGQKDLQTIIATGDMDALQLVDGKRVAVFTLRKGVSDTVVYDEDAVFARYGLKPEQLNDYRGLKGDPSDNISGVPGVGEKTAAELIKKFSDLEELFKFLEANKGQIPKLKTAGISEKLAERLLENKDKAFSSRELSTIVTDLDIDFTMEKSAWRKNADISRIETNFRDLGFSSLLKRLPEIGLNKAVAETPDLPKTSGAEELQLDPDENNIYVNEPAEQQIIKKILANPQAVIIGHDLKELFRSAIKQGKPFNKAQGRPFDKTQGRHIKNRIFDTKIAAYLLNPDQKDYDFSKVYYAEYNEIPGMEASRRPAYLWKLRERLWENIKSADLIKVFEDIEMPLVPVLAEMELYGIKINTKALAELLKSTNKELAKLETKIYELAGGEFNINSPQQLGEILYAKLGIKGRVRKTGGGALSTAAPELEKIREEHPIIDFILQYRELQKLKTTYIEPFPQLVDRSDGRLHTTYNQTGTGTGRLSSENPNLQNIPIKTELGREFRRAFIAEDGCQLVSFDYSQLELRVVAHIAKDEKMIEVFRRGEDIHTATAAEIFEVTLEQVTKEMRRQAKTLNFGIIYGMGPLGFARSAGVSTLRAREFITKYFADFSGVAKYMEEMKAKAHEIGYVETIFGRRRRLLDIQSTMPQLQAQAERAAINHPVQGTAADLMKLSMIGVSEFIHKNLDDKQARLLLQVHDELVFEIKTDLVQKLAKTFKQIMESVYRLDVPLIVDVKFGQNWQDMSLLAN